MKSTIEEIDNAIKQQRLSNGGDRSPSHLSPAMLPIETDARSARSVSTTSINDDDVSIASQETTHEPVAAKGPNNWQQHAAARSVLAARAKAQIDKAASQEKQKRQAEEAKYSNYNLYEDYAMPVAGLEFSDESEDEEPVNSLRSSLINGKRSSLGGSGNNSPKIVAANITKEAQNVPLPGTEPGTPKSIRYFGIEQQQQLRSSLPSTDMSHRGHSPSPSVSSRRSRKSMDAGIPPVPPVPVAAESPEKLPVSLPRVDEPTPTRRKSFSSSRRSSHSSMRRKSNASLKSMPDPLPAAIPSPTALSASVETDKSRFGGANDSVPPQDSIPTLQSLVVNQPSTANAPKLQASPARSVSPKLGQTPILPHIDQSPVMMTVPQAAQELPIPSYQTSARQSPKQEAFESNSGSIATPQTPQTYRSSDSPPTSQLGQSTVEGTHSIRTIDTSPRSSFGTAPKPADPRQWTVDQVVEWGRSKGYDQSTLSKFAGNNILFAYATL